jgi:lipopolysaccharide transport LptD-like protein
VTGLGPLRAGLGAIAIGCIAVLAVSAPAAAQVRDTTTRRVPPRDTIPRRDSLARRDSLGVARDTTRSRELVEWEPADSVMSALLARKGYNVTKYQGDRARFRADQRTIYLTGDPAAVQREQTVMVGDTIQFNDSTKTVLALGDTLVLRAPEQGQDDLVARGRLEYDVERHVGRVTNISTAVESGQRWIVAAHNAAFAGDTTGRDQSAFYGKGGILTSCTDSTPHYHFASREMKVVAKNVLVARPAVLYIGDIPVLWLPFVFQDLRTGRRSGLIPPRFGFSEIVRNSPTYRRTIEDFGWYWVINDYMDAETTMDWRSSARETDADPGWVRFSGLLRYAWLDRFLSGQIAASQHKLTNGTTNTAFSWGHQQQFSQRSRLTANLNYMTNTSVQRQTTFNPYQTLATINSQLNYQQTIGKMQFSVGGSQKQYPGRDELDRDFPSVSFTSQPIAFGEWLTWTPNFSLTNQQRFDIDQLGNATYRYRPNADGTGLDSTQIFPDTRNSSINFDTPLKIFGFTWRNTFRISDVENDYPQKDRVINVEDTTKSTSRTFAQTYKTSIDWETGIDLPALFRGTWNLTPSMSLSNVSSEGLLIRTHLTGGSYVSQRKRVSYGLSAAPTFYALFPGFGPISRFRHAISPTFSYNYSPAATVSDEFLAATGRTRSGYIGDLAQQRVSMNLATNIEAKRRQRSDTAQSGMTEGQPIKVLSLTFTPLTWDFERAKVPGRSGFATDAFGYTARSDLIPGFDIGVDYSLFQGSLESDTAVFKPFRTSVRGSLSLDKTSTLVKGIARLLGVDLAAPATGAGGAQEVASAQTGRGQGTFGPALANQPITGSAGRGAALGVPTGQGFRANLTFSSTRQRPITGSNVVTTDPRQLCAAFAANAFQFQQCLEAQATAPGQQNPLGQTTVNTPIFRSPPQTNLQGSMSFNITPKWAAQWSTSYDFVTNDFASHVVSLQRELHDWNAIFAFTQAPNGNFAFNFFIALRAQPDLKFNYDRRNVRRPASTATQQP